jgi:hypothetical protein
LGQRGYRSYQQKWTAEPFLERYLALIQDIQTIRSQPRNPIATCSLQVKGK